MFNDLDAQLALGKVSEYFEWRKWAFEIPYIQFPSEWKIRIVPPFGGAVVRFRVQLPGMNDDDSVSAYLDCYSMLGTYGLYQNEPYWEVYPFENDIGRCAMNDIERLLEMIRSNER